MAQPLIRQLGDYFDLRLPRKDLAAPGPDGTVVVARPAAGDVLWLVAVYLLQVAGVLAKQAYDDITAGRPLHMPVTTLVLAAVVSAVTFPTVHRSLQAESNLALRLFLAFQNGFFWRSLLGNLVPG
jgi:hypothetical protein